MTRLKVLEQKVGSPRAKQSSFITLILHEKYDKHNKYTSS